MRRIFSAGACAIFAMVHTCAYAQAAASEAASPASNMVVVTGGVTDEATHAAVLSKLQQIYGADRVQDQIQIESVVTPPGWNDQVVRSLSPSLKQISQGKIDIDGNTVRLSGNVANEALRQQIPSELASSLGSNYTLYNNLRVSAPVQGVLDSTLANRTVEFQSGSANLTPLGQSLLDEMAAALLKLGNIRVELIGHTDNTGNAQANTQLSLQRAIAVKQYLVQKGVPDASLSVTGYGPDRPIADNSTDTGRARNRRIEFHVLK